MPDSVRDGLWRPGGAFFQIGLGCVMSHHLSPYRRALHIPVLILAGKLKMEFLQTVSKSRAIAQICPNSFRAAEAISQKLFSIFTGLKRSYVKSSRSDPAPTGTLTGVFWR